MPRNPTPAQRVASRLNGARSRGPKTPIGLTASTIAPFKHGRYAKFTSVLPGESLGAFRAYFESLVERHIPAGDEELQLVELLAAIDWRLNRIGIIETRAIHNEDLHLMSTALPQDEEPFIADRYTFAVDSLLRHGPLLPYLALTENRLVTRRGGILRQLKLLQDTRRNGTKSRCRLPTDTIDPEIEFSAELAALRAHRKPPENSPQVIETQALDPSSAPPEGPEPPTPAN